MAVTIHLPKVHRLDTKRLAAVGVAVLATAVAFTGIQALTNTDTTTASSTSDGTIEVTTVGAVDTSALATWAQQNGLSGLSPASLAPQAAAATTYTLADELQAIHSIRTFDIGGQNVAANPAAVASIASVDAAMRAVVPRAEAVSVASVDAAMRAAVPNVGSYDVVEVGPVHIGSPDITFSNAYSSLAATDTNVGVGAAGDYDPYPVADSSAEGTTQARSNFASDIDWLVANGWATR